MTERGPRKCALILERETIGCTPVYLPDGNRGILKRKRICRCTRAGDNERDFILDIQKFSGARRTDAGNYDIAQCNFVSSRNGVTLRSRLGIA